MKKYYVFVESKALYVRQAAPYEKVHKHLCKTCYAKDKETAELIMRGKGYKVVEVLTLEELEKKVEENENNSTNEQ